MNSLQFIFTYRRCEVCREPAKDKGSLVEAKGELEGIHLLGSLHTFSVEHRFNCIQEAGDCFCHLSLRCKCACGE